VAINYDAIRKDNERRYGTDIGRIGPMLLADRYADRTHFIYELLQNAEDALVRRGPAWSGERAIRFALNERYLQVSHYGIPFDERDVRGICGIAESPKELTDIGRFGIGFKSVYAFTDQPEVHSGGEDFVIESFVWPKAVGPIERDADETVFILPLRTENSTAVEEITAGLKRLGPRVLLFLNAIEEISWSVQGGPSGQYLRDRPQDVGDNARRVELLWQEGQDGDAVDETWLVFDRPVQTEAGKTARHVEVAFRLDQDDGEEVVRRVNESPLVVFFPTVVETHLGFLVQGPYRTTPSRDNVPKDDHWNKYLVTETGNLLVDALHALREMNLLDANALRVLPLDRSRFAEGRMFAPLFEAVQEALRTEQLLPCFGGSYVAAPQARLARAQELRELFTPRQLAALFGEQGECAWLSEAITQDRTPDLRQYLMQELGVAEVTPESLIPKLNKSFLEAQSDEWVMSLYEFLGERPALHRRLDQLHLVRLDDGRHVRPKGSDGRALAFLPSAVKTGFPTVKDSVCCTEAARKFLESLGVREPDPVDDVILNVLPKYRAANKDVGDEEYADDIRRFLAAFQTDSTSQRSKLTDALGKAGWVRAVDAGDGSRVMATPGDVYLATERLKNLFEGVPGVLLVDASCDCLRGENVRELLEASGAVRYLRPTPAESHLTWEELREMRRKAGLERCTWSRGPSDYMLHGLDALLAALPSLDPAAREAKARLLWEALAELENRRGTAVFSGTYGWGYSHESKSATFDAAFVRRLNDAAWVPAPDGTLQTPGNVLFEQTGWTPNPFLFSKVRFKPPIVDQLAQEVGIDPGLIVLLKQLGLTSVEQLKARLGMEAEKKPTGPDDARKAAEDLLGRPYNPETQSGSGAGEPGTGDTSGPVSSGPSEGRSGGHSSGQGAGSGTGGTREGPGAPRRPGTPGSRPFISYVGVRPEDEKPDPDGLEHEERLRLEEQAIEFILTCESNLQRTTKNNPGFDLFSVCREPSLRKLRSVGIATGSMS